MSQQTTSAGRDAEARAERTNIRREIGELKRGQKQLSDKLDALPSADTLDELIARMERVANAFDNATFLVAVMKWAGGVVMAVSAFWFVVTHFGEGK